MNLAACFVCRSVCPTVSNTANQFTVLWCIMHSMLFSYSCNIANVCPGRLHLGSTLLHNPWIWAVPGESPFVSTPSPPFKSVRLGRPRAQFILVSLHRRQRQPRRRAAAAECLPQWTRAWETRAWSNCSWRRCDSSARNSAWTTELGTRSRETRACTRITWRWRRRRRRLHTGESEFMVDAVSAHMSAVCSSSSKRCLQKYFVVQELWTKRKGKFQFDQELFIGPGRQSLMLLL